MYNLVRFRPPPPHFPPRVHTTSFATYALTPFWAHARTGGLYFRTRYDRSATSTRKDCWTWKFHVFRPDNFFDFLCTTRKLMKVLTHASCKTRARRSSVEIRANGRVPEFFAVSSHGAYAMCFGPYVLTGFFFFETYNPSSILVYTAERVLLRMFHSSSV